MTLPGDLAYTRIAGWPRRAGLLLVLSSCRFVTLLRGRQLVVYDGANLERVVEDER